MTRPDYAGARRMPECAIVIDIETKADLAYLDTPRGKESLGADIEAPANYKDPVKIAEYVRQKAADRIEQAALHAYLAGVVAIGWADLFEGDVHVAAGTIAQEKETLSIFAAAMHNIRADEVIVCGWHIREFDLPFLSARCALHGVQMPRWWPHSKDWQRVYDAKDTLGEGKLAQWLAAFGLPPKTADGSQVANMTTQQIADYCCDDVHAERELIRKLAINSHILRPLAMDASRAPEHNEVRL